MYTSSCLLTVVVTRAAVQRVDSHVWAGKSDTITVIARVPKRVPRRHCKFCLAAFMYAGSLLDLREIIGIGTTGQVMALSLSLSVLASGLSIVPMPVIIGHSPVGGSSDHCPTEGKHWHLTAPSRKGVFIS